jgi:hypothetical protein
MSHRRSAVADAFYDNVYSYIEWLSTLYGQFFSMIVILVIVLGVRIYVENAETAKRLKEQQKLYEQAQAQKAWDDTPTLQKGIIISRTFLKVFLLGEKPS